MFLCKDWADFSALGAPFDGRLMAAGQVREVSTVRLIIEIIAATLFVVCITVSSAAFAAGRTGRSADGLSCVFSVTQNASAAVRCAAIKQQCGGKFWANTCRLLSAS